ncbi:hypothetical protein Gotri_027798 [Gossypium trilobum]|uniref:Uncharacterized protein n=1 Tax=Gossypium trilobum TaxID=34281 RepID=A0A7J9FR61_9ROSI|nr:hypothetical protein [Gossypium trilobum]
MVTSEYNEWWSKRVNDNIPSLREEDVRPIEEYLQVVPSEIEIIKKDFEKRNLELGKKIEQLEEEKNATRTRCRLPKEIQEENTKADQWEKKFQDARAREVTLEKGKIEELKGRVGELENALQNSELQIELLERVQADVLSLKYESESDRDRELAWLLRKVKALSIRAKPYIYPGTFLRHEKENKSNGSKSPVIDSGVDHEEPVYPPGPNVAENPLPDHANKGVNAIAEGGSKRIKADVMEVRTPMKCVWKQMVCRGLITRDLDERPKGAATYCEFHAKEGHNIQECPEFRTMVQILMDNKEIEFHEEIKGFEEKEVCASEEGPQKGSKRSITQW